MRRVRWTEPRCTRSFHRASPTAVSYTHLDVYKRPVSSELWSSPRPISTRLLNGSLHLHIVPINLVVFKGSYLFETMGYLISVSYTHLDVYKRQGASVLFKIVDGAQHRAVAAGFAQRRQCCPECALRHRCLLYTSLG